MRVLLCVLPCGERTMKQIREKRICFISSTTEGSTFQDRVGDHFMCGAHFIKKAERLALLFLFLRLLFAVFYLLFPKTAEIKCKFSVNRKYFAKIKDLKKHEKRP